MMFLGLKRSLINAEGEQAITSDEHLIQCLIHIDLNMVRAGVVRHPTEWAFSGYKEIQTPRERYARIDYERLMELLGFRSMHDLADAYRGWVEASLREVSHFRDGKWTESVAVGSEAFVRATEEKLGLEAKGREVVGRGTGASN